MAAKTSNFSAKIKWKLLDVSWMYHRNTSTDE